MADISIKDDEITVKNYTEKKYSMKLLREEKRNIREELDGINYLLSKLRAEKISEDLQYLIDQELEFTINRKADLKERLDQVNELIGENK